MANDHQTIRNLFNDWNQALASGDPEQVAALYADDAVLLPTVSNRVRTDRAGIRDYFIDFLQLQPQGEIQESHVRVHGDLALHSGVYLFTMGADNSQVWARFTFVYRSRQDQWEIIEQHSSAMPEG
ncbi:SgcJ/EcaC family oxidoreductase [Natronospirillum operosum]|uniref:SgcJ/EcaC family oxidoreductase n=1 Tax=Natronospirillum operosum TaxID=2759953 RepID=UPI00197BFC10|nr:SgcJ/EcaC family oxidoreductase [Natronospirillum operosum]